MTADGILVELRYPYGDILAVPNECYLLPTDDMSIIDSIILFYHEKGGHTNSRHTRWRIGRAFRWPHMRRDIERVCRRCVRCQFVAAYRRSRSIKRHLDTSARLPWQVISIDLLGPLKADVFRMQYVLVAICHLSRFVVLSALKDASTRSVVDALHDIWCLWGRPVVLRADNGPAFRGQFKRQMSSEGIRTQSVSRYSPWSNGVCERVMSTVKGFISGLNKSDTRRWSRFIPVVARRLNTKPLPEGKSPFEILFGRPYPEELETRLSAEEDSSQIDLTPDNEAARNLQLQQKLVVSEVLEDRERRDSPQDPNRVPSQPPADRSPVGSTVIRVPPSDRSGRLRQDKTIYEVVRLGGDGVTTYVRPVRSAVDADNNDDDSDVVREHCSNLKRFWGASCESPNS
ncbi:hypothetical protein FOZ60_002355 [Perkinsus olseni]|uniref:Integrase catalytic domain-containing protein n=1 Tax=Perkinsus olseni TaxID=32597 RepID=A0A7J6NZ28_PEROL|nr:hypothetical protein FOZ60_002355 [Perkinsus olseni]